MAESISDDVRTLRRWYHNRRFHSWFVHFPVALVPFAFLSHILFFASGRMFFFNSAFFALTVSLVLGVFTVGTGVMSWMINYAQSLDPRFRVKIFCSVLFLILTGITMALGLPAVTLQEINPPEEFRFNIVASARLTFVNSVIVFIIARYGKTLSQI
jgi:uncharacterized membrane protein